MPAPLGKTPTKKMPKIEVFGLEDSRPTRAAVRFFRERRIVVRFVDLGKRPIDAAELRAFMDHLGPTAVLEPGATDQAAARGALLTRLRTAANQLRIPLVRHGDEMTAGQDESTWRVWLTRRQGPGRQDA